MANREGWLKNFKSGTPLLIANREGWLKDIESGTPMLMTYDERYLFFSWGQDTSGWEKDLFPRGEGGTLIFWKSTGSGFTFQSQHHVRVIHRTLPFTSHALFLTHTLFISHELESISCVHFIHAVRLSVDLWQASQSLRSWFELHQRRKASHIRSPPLTS